MLVCPNQECGHRENLALLTNARCPNCHKKLTMSGEGEAKIYRCPCGFREKAEKFNERFKENGVSKYEVAKYLNSQKEESGPSAFELALQKAQKKGK